MSAIAVMINGAQGKMGRVAVESIKKEPDLELVATAGREDRLVELIEQHQPDLVIDLTVPTGLFERLRTMITAGVRPVVGTSGLNLEQVDALRTACAERSLGAVIAPNFSLTAVLMMRYAQDAAKYFPDAEIIEMHHPQKLDAPSGTAKKTAELMCEARHSVADSQPHPNIARGEQYHGVTIHSVRLPGLLAHQTVLFGGSDEILTVRQDSHSRNAFMPGLFLACRKVMELDHLVYGLDSIL